jgi:hypothetical protein
MPNPTLSREPLPHALVRWAYRLILGREPENASVIIAWSENGELAGLREGLLGSTEFAEHAAEGFPERGGWFHGPVSDDALTALLALRDGAMPPPEAVEAARELAPDLRALRRLLLDLPELRRRTPQRPRPRVATIELAGRSLRLHDIAAAPQTLPGRDIAARHAALLAACWGESGAGRVILDAEAGHGLATLGLAAGAPDHAVLLAHEPDLLRAAAVSANLAANGFTAARVRAVALDTPEAALAREELERLDALRLAGPTALRLGVEWTRGALARGALVILALDLAALLAEQELAPGAWLAACCAEAPFATAFTPTGEPYALDGAAARERFLLGALARPERADELVLSADGEWRAAFRIGAGALP